MRLQFWIALFLFPLVLRAGTNDGTILLHNNTTFILTAIIQASDGSYLGQFSVQPGQQRNFTQNMFTTQYVHPGTPDISLTPYTVVWQCPSQGIYTVCHGVSPGAYIKASDCEGTRFCSPKQEQQKTPAPASKLKKTM